MHFPNLHELTEAELTDAPFRQEVVPHTVDQLIEKEETNYTHDMLLCAVELHLCVWDVCADSNNNKALYFERVVSQTQSARTPSILMKTFFFMAVMLSRCPSRCASPGVGSLLARFQLSEGPSKPSSLAVQFTSEGSTLSGCDIELAGPGYRFSLIKKRFAAGETLPFFTYSAKQK